MRLLLVDDSPLTLKKMKRLVATIEGCEVLTAQNGQEALKVIAEYPESHFDLLITDLHMPVMDGFELLKTLQEKGFQTPTYVSSADQQASSKEKVLQLGALDLIQKPDLYKKEKIEELVKSYRKSA